jgi:ribosomal protein S18 acetylase RimI-like enzyme
MTHRRPATTIVIRPAVAADRSALETLVAETCAATRQAEPATYALRGTFERPTGESQALVAELSGAVVGVALFGDVAGTIGTGRVHFVGTATHAQRRGTGTVLCDRAVQLLTARGARHVVAEIPDDPSMSAARAMLGRCEFTEVARVPDYYSDGVSLVILQRRIRT